MTHNQEVFRVEDKAQPNRCTSNVKMGTSGFQSVMPLTSLLASQLLVLGFHSVPAKQLPEYNSASRVVCLQGENVLGKLL